MRKRIQTNRLQGFTLAELLVTLSIIGLLFALALPVLTGITMQSKLDGASHSVYSAVKLARQTAITQDQPAYILFNDIQSTDDLNLAYRSYAVFTVNTHTTPVTQSSGHFVTEWETLPAGIVFNNSESENANNVFVIGNDQWAAGFSRYSIMKIGTNTFPALAFKPKGTQRKEWNHDIYLSEGFYDGTGNLTTTSSQGKRIRIESAGQGRITDMSFTEDGKAAELSL